MTQAGNNSPDLWRAQFPFPKENDHKYSRGTLLIRGGGEMTGASRLAARAAQRVGAGLVTLAAPASAVSIYAESLESVIVKKCDRLDEWNALLAGKHEGAVLIGPGLGIDEAEANEILAALGVKRATVLDADIFSNFADEPQKIFDRLHPHCVMTPHEGEFACLFGAIAGDRQQRAAAAARHAGCVIVLKGHETIIAAPDGQMVINRDAPPWLATAGSGDVLAGITAGLLAQKMPVFHAACAAVWLHSRIADIHGPGLIAEDLVDGIPQVLQEVIS